MTSRRIFLTPFKITLQLDDNDISTILGRALGSNDWITEVKCPQIDNGTIPANVKLQDCLSSTYGENQQLILSYNSDRKVCHAKLTRDKLIKGILLFLNSEFAENLSDYIRLEGNKLFLYYGNLSDGLCDIILQYAVHKEVIMEY